MLANLLIGLREGLEAALIVGILVAYLVKTNRTGMVRAVFIGVVAAIFLSVAAGLLLNFIVEDVEAGTNQIIGGTTSILAVGFVTWMIFWMKNQSRAMAGELRGRLEKVSETSVLSISGIAFLAVIREGIETSIFLWSSSKATSVGDNPIIGAVIGLIAAAVLGYFIYRGALKINLSKFFAYTGTFLIVVSAGILAYAVMEFEEITKLPLQNVAYDLSSILPENGFAETLLHGLVSFNTTPTTLQFIVWWAYFLPVTIIYLRTARKS